MECFDHVKSARFPVLESTKGGNYVWYAQKGGFNDGRQGCSCLCLFCNFDNNELNAERPPLEVDGFIPDKTWKGIANDINNDLLKLKSGVGFGDPCCLGNNVCLGDMCHPYSNLKRQMEVTIAQANGAIKADGGTAVLRLVDMDIQDPAAICSLVFPCKEFCCGKCAFLCCDLCQTIEPLAQCGQYLSYLGLMYSSMCCSASQTGMAIEFVLDESKIREDKFISFLDVPAPLCVRPLRPQVEAIVATIKVRGQKIPKPLTVEGGTCNNCDTELVTDKDKMNETHLKCPTCNTVNTILMGQAAIDALGVYHTKVQRQEAEKKAVVDAAKKKADEEKALADGLASIDQEKIRLEEVKKKNEEAAEAERLRLAQEAAAAEAERLRLAQEAAAAAEAERLRLAQEAEVERARLAKEAEETKSRLEAEAAVAKAKLEEEARIAKETAEREEKERQERIAREEQERAERVAREEKERLDRIAAEEAAAKQRLHDEEERIKREEIEREAARKKKEEEESIAFQAKKAAEDAKNALLSVTDNIKLPW